MACTVKELRVFLAGCDGDDMIGVDDGGLTLVVVDDPGTFFEIGGIPLDDEEIDDEYDPSSDFDRYTCTADKGDCNCEACRKAK